jgi:hypothetical protein
MVWLGRLVGVLGLALSLGASAQTIESVLAPGPVIQGHAKVENDCKSCHSPFDRAAQDNLCIACHKDVGADLRQHTGFHGRQSARAQCRTCHTEHRGRDARLATVDVKTFDHRTTDFALLDKHRSVECGKCHVTGKQWREAPTECVACHARDDAHKGGLGRDCASCHDARGWALATFDHGAKTHFALDGKHASVKCDGCHANGRFKNTPSTCVGCHRKDDAHKGMYGDKCESCHAATAWKPSTFDHDMGTRFRLRGRHREVKCASCHTGPLFKVKLGTTCVECHLKDDKHKGSLGSQCADCHAERSWKEPSGFDHAKTRFPLLGKHGPLECKQCHADAQYRKTPVECVACHRKDDKHQGNLGTDCAACHRADGWKATRGLFDHSRTKFPLRHAHAAPGVKCQDCHVTLHAMRGTSTECIACHRRDDRHEGTLDERCGQCHTDERWRIERFDHARTRFVLTGRHLVVECASCHKSLRFRDAGRDCVSCHRKDDAHKGGLGSECATCHNTRDWTLWDFDHDRKTQYPLLGRHRELRCVSCHLAPVPAGRPIARVGTDCVSCHRKDDAHDGNFGRRCEQCHVPQAWRQLRQGVGPTPRQLPSAR